MIVVDIFNAFTEIGWSNVIIVLFLIMLFPPVAKKTWDELLKAFGLESKRSRLEREREEMIEHINTKITELETINHDLKEKTKNQETRIQELEDKEAKLEMSADKFNDDRIKDREVSRDIRNKLDGKIDAVVDKVDKLICSVDALAEQTRKYELDDIRETLMQAHRYYTNTSVNPLKAWTAMEAHAFWEQYSNYEDRGGNGYMHATVKPEMNKLVVVQMDDYEKMAELMSSRNQIRD